MTISSVLLLELQLCTKQLKIMSQIKTFLSLCFIIIAVLFAEVTHYMATVFWKRSLQEVIVNGQVKINAQCVCFWMINWCPCELSHIPGVHVERAVDGSHVPHSNEYHVHYSPHSQAPEAEQFPNALLPHPQVEPVHSKPSQRHTETHNTPNNQ